MNALDSSSLFLEHVFPTSILRPSHRKRKQEVGNGSGAASGTDRANGPPPQVSPHRRDVASRLRESAERVAAGQDPESTDEEYEPVDAWEIGNDPVEIDLTNRKCDVCFL